ncbi:GNAT family N-acetyltransferase [Micromonospora purpureochromogenes]|uniref:RimJ/RimL family protein N-acetyltransferase n=1 Tax=Micromonospora purpureochromogenes TaxID=47872 RepID=A0ABX2RMU4_9ACTN|nr:GNAT family N-acetyltransferase [Micromonospora purpureochromogenes]NYF57862.1 RimJ/RimL family protein N-acetyltransferase [Micromonospora purpureochromogenes]
MPTPILRTDRLLLEPYRPADADDFVALLSDPEVARYMGDGPMTPDDAAALFGRVFTTVYAEDLFDVWAVRRDGRYVGHAEIKRTDQVEGHELVYALAKPAWGAGLGTELARALVRYGFDTLDLARVYATVAEANTASLALLAKLGFVHQRDITEDDGSVTRVLAVDRAPLPA